MKPLKANEIFGNWVPPMLPINEDDSIDWARLRDEVDILAAAKVNGIYTNGTTSEFYAQSEDEFDRIQALVAEKCEAGGIPFQIGASHTSPQTCLNRIKRAVMLKPGAIQVILPDWFPVSDAEAVAFLQRAAEAADPIGLVLYNPPHAKRVLKPPDYAKLKAAVPGMVGIKVMDGDEAWYEQMRVCAAGLSVFVPGQHLATGFGRGAAGAYSNIACLNPVPAQRWYEMMKSDLNAALQVESCIRGFLTEHIVPFITQQGFSNQAVDKLLAAIGGWTNAGTRLRWPYRWIAEDEVKRLRRIATTMIPEFAGPSIRAV